MDLDHAHIHGTAMKHLAACEEQCEAEDHAEGNGNVFVWPEGLATSGPSDLYCGCDTCVVREVLYAGFVAAGVIES